eukprot:PhF_6_TR12292/c0_g1_i1/m.19512
MFLPFVSVICQFAFVQSLVFKQTWHVTTDSPVYQSYVPPTNRIAVVASNNMLLLNATTSAILHTFPNFGFIPTTVPYPLDNGKYLLVQDSQSEELTLVDSVSFATVWAAQVNGPAYLPWLSTVHGVVIVGSLIGWEWEVVALNMTNGKIIWQSGDQNSPNHDLRAATQHVVLINSVDEKPPRYVGYDIVTGAFAFNVSNVSFPAIGGDGIGGHNPLAFPTPDDKYFFAITKQGTIVQIDASNGNVVHENVAGLQNITNFGWDRDELGFFANSRTHFYALSWNGTLSWSVGMHGISTLDKQQSILYLLVQSIHLYAIDRETGNMLATIETESQSFMDKGLITGVQGGVVFLQGYEDKGNLTLYTLE